MNEYRFHWWPPAATIPHVTLEAESTLHGGALALRRFMELGCDLTAAAAHIDITDATGVKHTLLVEEVLDWLKDPGQNAFVEQERLGKLLQIPSA